MPMLSQKTDNILEDTGGSLSFADLLKRGWLGEKSCVPEASKSCSHCGNSKGDVGRDHC